MFSTCRGLRMLPLALTVLLPLGCGGESGGDQTTSQGPAADAAPAVEVANPATIRGQVHFQGTPPPAQPIDMSAEPECAAKHPNGATTQAVVVNDNGTLRNVFVYVKEGLPAGQRYPTPSEGVEIDQIGCVYVPHVLGLQTGQDLVIKNDDGLLHNIKAVPTNNRGFNISQPRSMESTRTFNTPEVAIPVECNVHGWMQAYIGVLDHPYFAVTGEDGSFEIRNLPPGSYVLESWHEQYGTQTQNLTVAPDATQEVQFQYSAAMAADAVVPLGEPIRVLHRGGEHRHAAAGGTVAGGRR